MTRDIYTTDLVQMGYKAIKGERINMFDYATWTQWEWEIVDIRGTITTLKPIKQI